MCQATIRRFISKQRELSFSQTKVSNLSHEKSHANVHCLKKYMQIRIDKYICI